MLTTFLQTLKSFKGGKFSVNNSFTMVMMVMMVFELDLFAKVMGMHNLHDPVHRVFYDALSGKDVVIAWLKLLEVSQRHVDFFGVFLDGDSFEASLVLVIVATCIHWVQRLEHVLS